MAMGRLNRPAIMVYGGTIKPGFRNGEKLDIVSAFQCYGQFIAGQISDDERQEIVEKRLPRRGCLRRHVHRQHHGEPRSKLWNVAPVLSEHAREDPDKKAECVRAGDAILELLKRDIKPRDIMTRAAFENAMVTVMALGGSTNAVLHLIAMARSVDVPLTIDDFQSVSDRVPYLADLKPSGKFVQEDLHSIGGTPAVMKYLLEKGLMDGSCLTVTERRLRRTLPISQD